MKKIIAFLVGGALIGALGAGLPLYIQLNDANNRADLLDLQRVSLEQQVSNLESEVGDANNTIQGLNADLNTLQLDYQATSTELGNTKTELKDTNKLLSDALGEISSANAEIDSLTGDLQTANGEIADLNRQLVAVNLQLGSVAGQLEAANLDIDEITDQLNEIRAKYPLKDFPDYQTLTTWISANTQPYSPTYGPWFSHALKVQEAGANDGYYVSVFVFESNDYLFVVNAALVGNIFYIWDPEDPSDLIDWWEGTR